MKKLYTLLFIAFAFITNAQIVNIPDANFKAKLLQASPSIQIAKSTAGLWIKVDANNDGEIQSSEASQVAALYVNFSSISLLTGIESFTNLKILSCYNNNITTLDVSMLPLLQELYCYNNSLTSLNVSNTALKRLECQYNYLLTTLNYSGLEGTLEYFDNFWTSVSLLNFTNFLELITLKINHFDSQLISLNINNCPNLESINTDNSVYQILNVNINNCPLLNELTVNGYNVYTSLTISNCSNLGTLNCEDLSNSVLNLSSLINLTNLIVAYSPNLTSLNCSALVNLTSLNCSSNALTSLDVSGLTNLTNLNCQSNQIASLNLTGLFNLQQLNCGSNQILSLDLSDCHSIQNVDCTYNQIIEMFMKNGKEENIDFSGNPILLYICTDDNEMATIQTQVDALSYNNCQVNSYCSFAPGGAVFNIVGHSKLDTDLNGCSTADVDYANLKLNITDGVNSGSVISNETGNYSIPVSAGTHTVTPVLENPSYFTISPTSFNVVFPTTASPFTQDFCIVPNGNHSDLEITLIPIDAPVPGFNVKYKLVYKNKGNLVANGQISLTFDDTVLDFVSSIPAFTNTATGSLSLDYTNLLPFESRSVEFIMNLNTTMDTPPLNGGDFLNYTATINLIATDETPTDNVFILNQTVVNSYDPNDKTCLEGETINPSMIGDYVHYQIRFENTGTFPAQNVVVKDMIDATKFDIATLQMVITSHSCYTRITGNKVEFIFENINLPFDDATNDGYVVFKIKTLPTLTINSTISNTAEIYFDYNFPIVTNTATSTYQVLANQDFDFANEFTLYPNPVKNVLNINAKNGLEIQSLEIYNTFGQLVIAKPNFEQTIDVSVLPSGTYFIKASTEKGSGSMKFVKQ